MFLYTAKGMREVDRIAIEEMGIPSLTLMEQAGQAFVNVVLEGFPEFLEGAVTILCGKGNNGGDGMVVARLLKGLGHRPDVVLLTSPDSLSGDAGVQYERLGPAGVPVEVVEDGEGLRLLAERLRDRALVVDAILGTGTRGPLTGFLASAVETLNASGNFVVSVDIPSGLSGNSTAPEGPAVFADVTITLAEAKPILVTPEAEDYCGQVILVDIGIPEEASARVPPTAETLDEEWAEPFFETRPNHVHKGTVGKVLLVAGSLGKTGAAVLSALGALRAGAGLVTVALPEEMLPVVAGAVPELMTLPLPQTVDGTLSMDALTPLISFASGVDAVGMGPGMGTIPETAALIRELYHRLEVPIVVDADALTAFEMHGHDLARHPAPRILTPHPGEMACLCGLSAGEVLESRYGLVPDRADEWNAILLLKGYQSLVAAPRRPWRINTSGGPHMAAPGMGDVLTGIVTALLGSGMNPFDAASLAAWWHGAAADAAYEELGGYGLLASEVADALPSIEGGIRQAFGTEAGCSCEEC